MDQFNLDFELESLDFDVAIEGVNCRMSMPGLQKLTISKEIERVMHQTLQFSSVVFSGQASFQKAYRRSSSKTTTSCLLLYKVNSLAFACDLQALETL